MSESAISLDVNDIKEWRSIVTLIVFVITSARNIPSVLHHGVLSDAHEIELTISLRSCRALPFRRPCLPAQGAR